MTVSSPANTKRGKTIPDSTSLNQVTDSPVSNTFGIEFRDQNQKKRFETLIKRGTIITKYLDSNVLRALGLTDDINCMIEKVGWSHFMSITPNTYERLTYEFLSSLDAHILRGKHAKECLITFRLFNKDHALTLEAFNQIYKLPVGGERLIPKTFLQRVFWRQISKGPEYSASTSKATSIPNPCFRYMHRVMAHTICGRGTSGGSVGQTELFLLWCMAEGFKVDSGAFLVRHLRKVGKAEKGVIAIGGLVTPIAEHLNLHEELATIQPLQGNHRIDLEFCIAMSMIKKVSDMYSLTREANAMPMFLPSAHRQWFRDQRQWLVPDEVPVSEPLSLEQPPQPAPQSSQQQGSTTEPHFRRELQSIRNLLLIILAKHDAIERDTVPPPPVDFVDKAE